MGLKSAKILFNKPSSQRWDTSDMSIGLCGSLTHSSCLGLRDILSLRWRTASISCSEAVSQALYLEC